MRKIKEALRLNAAGLATREISASIGAGKTTVYELLARAEGAGIGWPLADDLDEEQLEAILYPPASAAPGGSRPGPQLATGAPRAQKQTSSRHLAAPMARVER